jgi:hypothetical protein
MAETRSSAVAAAAKLRIVPWVQENRSHIGKIIVSEGEIKATLSER